ncbi:MAG: hypothetical protein NTV49_02120 [Kiritimatiellaeota bacterium]|nr:hypothetical protein [Kiritimatiellota bacterium]
MTTEPDSQTKFQVRKRVPPEQADSKKIQRPPARQRTAIEAAGLYETQTIVFTLLAFVITGVIVATVHVNVGIWMLMVVWLIYGFLMFMARDYKTTAEEIEAAKSRDNPNPPPP